MAIFLHNGPCPKCGSRDNLATYDDDSAWCWGCHFYNPPSISGFVAKQRKQEQDDGDEEAIVFPSDLTRDFPQEVVSFIQPYGLTLDELIRYDYSWSRYSGSLWRALFHSPGDSIPKAGEGRRVLPKVGGRLREGHSTSYPKSLFRGSKDDVFPIACPTKASAGTEQAKGPLVLVEDSLSSLKVGRVAHSMPLFGTTISISKIETLIHKWGYRSVVVWLDHDKFKEAWEIANKFKWLGVGTKVVLTQLDPKYYSEQEIKDFIK